ncbi:serine threonine protein kinase [Fusarium austroafricanum]|uniref:Serine threonine protein kinase n=1 Tax=Fusarium austroafricanum TaxID=2364996 RepID=A0A8H4JDE6_9HYPO|nr:serine threonine protein kinase [Fusarium austroafricanum]
MSYTIRESKTPSSNPDDVIIVRAKGDFIAGGTTSLVELLPSGDVVKTPLMGDAREEDCRKEIAIEAQVYKRLNEHPRLVKMKHWDSEECTLTLEYMPNGTLEEYVRAHGAISWDQKLRWILEATEAICLLHTAGIIHCDIGPHNFLLDANLSLKIADFSGSSLDGSCAMVCPGVRYRAPNHDWKPGQPPTIKEDLFSLGSPIYYIITGESPFQQLPDRVVKDKFLSGVFPDLSGNPCEWIIRLCWEQEVYSAEDVLNMVDTLTCP